MKGILPLLDHGSYSGSAQTYQELVKFIFPSHFNTLRSIILLCDTAGKGKFKIWFAGLPMVTDLILPGTKLVIPIGYTIVHEKVECLVEGCSSDGTSVVIQALLSASVELLPENGKETTEIPSKKRLKNREIVNRYKGITERLKPLSANVK